MSDELRPPYVQFELRAVEDRAASIEAGHYVAKDVVFALVTPPGTRDVLEKEAEEWIKGLDEAAKQERIPQMWPTLYRQALAAWKSNQEVPEVGTPIATWGQLSPAQVKNILAANIRTVEDLAEATEEALARIGMGAQALKSKAKAFLDTAKDTGKTSSELAALRQQVSDLETTNANLRTKVAALEKAAAKEKA